MGQSSDHENLVTPKTYARIRRSEREEVLGACREKLAAMMIRVSIATGHGDTFDDLLGELEAALKERMTNGGA